MKKLTVDPNKAVASACVLSTVWLGDTDYISCFSLLLSEKSGGGGTNWFDLLIFVGV